MNHLNLNGRRRGHCVAIPIILYSVFSSFSHCRGKFFYNVLFIFFPSLSFIVYNKKLNKMPRQKMPIEKNKAKAEPTFFLFELKNYESEKS